MADTGLVQIIEGALMAAGNPLTPVQIAELFEEQERPSTTEVREAMAEVSQRCEDRGFELLEVAGGFRFQVLQSLSPWVARLWQERPQKYSRAMLETLALIAYRQPITRGEIEEIRGVAVSSNIIKTLHEREWVRVVGHRDVPGRPAMYATTRQFLDYFNLKTLDQLPALAEIRDFETLTAELGFTDVVPEPVAGSEPGPESVPESESGPESESSSDSQIELDAQSGGEDARGEDPQNCVVSDSESDSPLTVVGGTDHVADEGESSDQTPQPTEAGI
jgi:segregation and condensation protein B